MVAPDDIVASLSSGIGALAQELTGTKAACCTDREWRFRSRGSLAVVVKGPTRGAWFDHEAGVGGHALGLIAHLRHCSMSEAAAWGRLWLNREPVAKMAPAVDPRIRPKTTSTNDMAKRLWGEAQPAAGTLVAVYAASRGLQVPLEAPLRFHPACPRGCERLPAMLALMTHPLTGEPCGVHRTFLTADGRGKAPGQSKMMMGQAGIVRLVPDEAVAAGLGIAEGIETSLAIMQRFGWSPVWAAASAGAIARFPVLAGLERLTVFADGDGAGERAAAACALRWAQAGRDTAIIAAPPGEDFASVVVTP